ncbi:MAG: DUF4738 domain-containing protein [Bacteroidetes bacterium]|nr:MAG: DUF4738 domain-containing protein [Bacteroidota bacterium]
MIYRNVIFSTLLLLELLACNASQPDMKEETREKAFSDSQIVYHPLQKDSFKVDTRVDLERGYRMQIDRVAIEAFSEKEEKTDSHTLVLNRFRDYKSTIRLFKNDSLLGEQSWVKSDFSQIGDPEFIQQAITHNTWYSGYDREKQAWRVIHAIAVPDTDWSYWFSIYVTDKGEFNVELDEIE